MVGFELGSMTINVILTFGAVIVVMVAGLVAGVATVPLAIATVVVGVAVPLLAYPFTQTVWFAVDLSMRRPEAKELAEAANWQAERADASG
jgi:ABC-type uncharacterized transport system permease subunit